MGALLIAIALLVLPGASARAQTAVCGNGIVEAGEQCDDGNTLDGDCCSSTCQNEPSGQPCPDDGNVCTDDVCDASGACTHPDNTAPCDDGLFCDGLEVCAGGICTHGGDPCAAGPECARTCNEAAANCFDPAGTACTSDGNPCTDDQCDGAGMCIHASNSAPCDDGVFCNGPDLCAGGLCTHSGDPCTGGPECARTCNEAAANCFDPAGTACTSDVNPCTLDQCDGSGGCAHPAGNAGALCRPAAGPCDLAESCTGTSATCPPDVGQPDTAPCDDGLFCTVNDVCNAGVCHGEARDCSDAGDQCNTGTCDGVGNACVATPRPNGATCNDGNPCTRNDTCQGGTCGGDPVVCVALDGCHLAGTCDSLTGTCSNPTKPDNVSCDDGDACSGADSCQGGVCRGFALPGCCRNDGECDDGFACTEDRCVDRACVHLGHDERCAPTPECVQAACTPATGADASGCVSRAADEAAFCTEDGDPCTTDACRAGTCTHQPDGSGPTCPMLAAPFQTALYTLTLARSLQSAVLSAASLGCPVVPACELAPGRERDRMVALLGAARMDLEAALVTVAGRAPGPSASDVTVRARLALGLIAGTPGELRSFLATLAQAQAQHVVVRPFARARRVDVQRVLGGTRKLARQLRRLVARRGTFVPAP